MDKEIIGSYFKFANNEDYIKIDFGNKNLEIPKRFLQYAFLGNGYYLELQNKGKKETYLIKTDSIDLITIIKPKFKGMTWYNQGQKKIKAGA